MNKSMGDQTNPFEDKSGDVPIQSQIVDEIEIVDSHDDENMNHSVTSLLNASEEDEVSDVPEPSDAVAISDGGGSVLNSYYEIKSKSHGY